MTSQTTPISPSAAETSAVDKRNAFPQFPVETDILITQDGQVIIADLPHELKGLLARLGKPAQSEPGESDENLPADA